MRTQCTMYQSQKSPRGGLNFCGVRC